MTSGSTTPDHFDSRASLRAGGVDYGYHRLDAVGDRIDLAALPVTIKILLENLLRHAGGPVVRPEDVETLLAWRPGVAAEAEIPFMPARVLLQDFTGVPAVVDLAVMRDAMADLGGDPGLVNPLVPADLVIDHSVQIDRFGTPGAFAFNVEREYDRNGERYQLLRWAQTAFRDLRVVPPGTGIVHQVNLEFLATVVTDRAEADGRRIAYPDTVVGTDSHTTMVNGLGVLGYGVGGIEAEAVLLGQPLYQPMPHVVGLRLHGALPRGSTATDLVLVVTELLRAHGVVGSFVEFAGDGLATLALADRTTISNMSPEFGATSTLFPIDDETLTYLRLTGRSADRVDLVERYAKTQGLWREPGAGPVFDELLELDLASVDPSVAGPRRPQDRVPLEALRANFRSNFPNGLEGTIAELGAEEPVPGNGLVEGSSAESFPASDPPSFTSGDTEIEAAPPAEPVVANAAPVDLQAYRAVAIDMDGRAASVRTGSVAIAAITSCTNTSNPTVMVGAGLLARNAVARGLRVGPTVKTSLAPGSRVVTSYLEAAGLMAPLETLGFALAGYGCTTCIGNSGPLDDAVAAAIEANDLVVAAVLSGNRNFEGRIHPLARASYLASPPLVVAFALAGKVDIDLTREPLGTDVDDRPVFLADIWPEPEEIRAVIGAALDPELFRRTYATVFEGDDRWRALPIPEGDRYDWEAEFDLHREAAVLRGAPPGGRRAGRAGGPAGPGRAGQFGHHRPHLPRRFDLAVVAGRPVAPGPRRRTARLQLVRGAAWPPRGDDARHVRQHPAAQPAGRGQGGAVHGPPARRRRGVHLRRGDALRGRGRPAGHPGRPRIRLRVVARLGGQGTGAPRRPDGPGRELRADPSLEPGRDGHPAPPVPARRHGDLARPDRPRDAVGRPRRPAHPAPDGASHGTFRRWGRATVRGHRPPGRADRRRLLPGRRDPAGRPPEARRELRSAPVPPHTKKPPGEEPGASTRRSRLVPGVTRGPRRP